MYCFSSVLRNALQANSHAASSHIYPLIKGSLCFATAYRTKPCGDNARIKRLGPLEGSHAGLRAVFATEM